MYLIARPRQDFSVTVKPVFPEPLLSAKKFRKSANLTANLLICEPSANVEICRFAICNLFVICGFANCGLKISAKT